MNSRRLRSHPTCAGRWPGFTRSPPRSSGASSAATTRKGLSRYNIVPGLVGTISTMTMVMLTTLAMTCEREHGAMENLLPTPVLPAEMMVGRIVLYGLLGYVQLAVILGGPSVVRGTHGGQPDVVAGHDRRVHGGQPGVGFTFPTHARNPLQALQLTFFIFLPSMLLSGFTVPFRCMPGWAQLIGSGIPLTRFLRIVRGITPRGTDAAELVPELEPMLLFPDIAGGVDFVPSRRTLD